ncbi:MAG: hypothetical protein QXL94_08670, partial [Candidatus Parvarchaeum sp.]
KEETGIELAYSFLRNALSVFKLEEVLALKPFYSASLPSKISIPLVEKFNFEAYTEKLNEIIFTESFIKSVQSVAKSIESLSYVLLESPMKALPQDELELEVSVYREFFGEVYEEIYLEENVGWTIDYYEILEFIRGYFYDIPEVSLNSIYDLKNYDIKRQGSGVIVWLSDMKEDYIGFGNQSFITYTVYAELYLMGVHTSSQLDQLVSYIHLKVAAFSPNVQISEREQIVWLKLKGERNFQEKVRGITRYRFIFEAKTYNTMLGGRYGIRENV